MFSSPDLLHPFMNELISNPTFEPGAQVYGEHLKNLNEIVRQSGEPIEGNLFTDHNRAELLPEPEAFTRGKRRNYALFATSGKSLMEIGFNAGHSTMLALAVNPDLHIDSVDIGMHVYTRPCYEYLRAAFPGRLRLHIGDSRDILPILRLEKRRFDIYHIDGGHGITTAQSDLANVLAFDCHGATLLMDDTDNPMIDGICDYYELRGDLTRLRMNTLWSATERWSHALFRMHPQVR